MITAKFYLKPSNGSIHMTLKGHAQAAPYGEDLICASATMLVYTVGQAVTFMYEQGQLEEKPRVSIREGKAIVVAKPKEEYFAEALHTFWVAQCGAHTLACNYPEAVSLNHLTV